MPNRTQEFAQIAFSLVRKLCRPSLGPARETHGCQAQFAELKFQNIRYNGPHEVQNDCYRGPVLYISLQLYQHKKRPGSDAGSAESLERWKTYRTSGGLEASDYHLRKYNQGCEMFR